MYSTFHGLETARRGLNTHQAALYVTGHNLANANTPGYTRQRANITPTEPFPKPALNAPRLPGQLGTGSKVDSMTRIRDQFLDLQYREKNSKFGYWNSQFNALERMEDILNEPMNASGIASTMNKFWRALEDLSVHPEDSGTRTVVRKQGETLAQTFNYVSNSLKSIQRDLKEEIGGTITNVNKILAQINNLNKEISDIEPHGFIPNDLYDRRDVLVDQLSEIVNIRVERHDSGGLSRPEAEGLYSIRLVDEKGADLLDDNGDPIFLVNGKRDEGLTYAQFGVNYDGELGDPNATGLIDKLTIAFGYDGTNNPPQGGSKEFDVADFVSEGFLLGQMKSFGYLATDPNDPSRRSEAGTYPEMLDQLDLMVYTFVEEFNRVHRDGWTLVDTRNGQKGAPIDFFAPLGTDYKGAASAIRLSDDILSTPDNIAASVNITDSYEVLKPTTTTYTGPGIKVRGLYNGIEGKIVVEYNKTNDTWNYKILDQKGEEQEAGPLSIVNNKFSIHGLEFDVTNVTPGSNTRWDLNVHPGYVPTGHSGDGSNALNLANVKDTILDFGGTNASVTSFFQGLIGDMAVRTESAYNNTVSMDFNRESVDYKRQSIGSVSLDEEFTNMIQFQHGYNAAARMITTIDQLLDRIINQMGLVGR